MLLDAGSSHADVSASGEDHELRELMKKFYTKNTVEAPEWCATCNKVTTHDVIGGRPAGCQECKKRLQAEHDKNKDVPPPPRQGGLF